MSLPRYLKYQDSGVEWLGLVPAKWEVVRLKNVAHINMGQSPSSEDCNQDGIGIPFLQGNADFGQTSPRPRSYCDCAAKMAMCGDLLFSVRAPVGAINVADQKYGIGRGLCAIRGTSEIHSTYLRYMMELARDALLSVATGSTYEAVSVEQVASVRFLKPSWAEQKIIAEFLEREVSKIDTLIAGQDKLISLLIEKRQATISNSVRYGLNPKVKMKYSGVDWLGDIPSHWEVVGLTKYLESVIDYRGRTPTKVDDGVFLITSKNIRDGFIDYETSQEYIAPSEYKDVMRRGLPRTGDVLFTTEAPLGQVALVDREGIALAQRIIKFRADPSRLSNAFLRAWVMGSACQFNLEQLATGSTALGIKGSKVGQVRLCLPPLAEQKEIVSSINSEVAKLERLQAVATSAVVMLMERRRALIAAAVTGQIDVRGVMLLPTVPEEFAA